MKRTWKFAAAGLTAATAVTLGVLLIPSASAAPAGGDYTIGQFNMAGGNGEYGKKGDEVPDALVRSVQDRKPAWMTLQETCVDWNKRLTDKLSGYAVKFGQISTGSGADATCKHSGVKFGNSILFRKDI